MFFACCDKEISSQINLDFFSLHRIVREYIDKFKLRLHPFNQTEKNAWYLIQNVRQKMALDNNEIFGYQLNPNERGKSANQLFEETLNKVVLRSRLDVQADKSNVLVQF